MITRSKPFVRILTIQTVEAIFAHMKLIAAIKRLAR